jgi:hypothetical protein
MTAPTKFLFDTDFAGGPRKPVEPMITLAEHEVKLAEAETAGHRRGYAQAQNDARVEADRRIAATLENIAKSIATANEALHAIEARLECEADHRYGSSRRWPSAWPTPPPPSHWSARWRSPCTNRTRPSGTNSATSR